MILVQGTATATTANLLASTDLQSAPGQGVVLCWCGCTQIDWYFSFGAPPSIGARNTRPLYVAAAGQLSMQDQAPIAVPVNGGEQIILSCTLGTAGTFTYSVKFIPQAEL